MRILKIGTSENSCRHLKRRKSGSGHKAGDVLNCIFAAGIIRKMIALRIIDFLL
jgi:hypothetical protein